MRSGRVPGGGGLGARLPSGDAFRAFGKCKIMPDFFAGFFSEPARLARQHNTQGDRPENRRRWRDGRPTQEPAEEGQGDRPKNRRRREGNSQGDRPKNRRRREGNSQGDRAQEPAEERRKKPGRPNPRTGGGGVKQPGPPSQIGNRNWRVVRLRRTSLRRLRQVRRSLELDRYRVQSD